MAQGQIRNLVRDLSQGIGCSAEGKPSAKSRDRMRIDCIPLRDADGEVEGFAVIRQMVGAAAIGITALMLSLRGIAQGIDRGLRIQPASVQRAVSIRIESR